MCSHLSGGGGVGLSNEMGEGKGGEQTGDTRSSDERQKKMAGPRSVKRHKPKSFLSMK